MKEELQHLIASTSDSPHAILGPHRSEGAGGEIVIRTFMPGAESVVVHLLRPAGLFRMEKMHPDGLFEIRVPAPNSVIGLDYRLQVTDGNGACRELQDAYRFPPEPIPTDEESRFLQGQQTDLFRRLGAHPESVGTVAGVRFGVWAPNARRVSVVGNFNDWDGRRHPMSRIGRNGIWALFIPDVKPGDFYKFEILTPAGAGILKTDPFAFRIEASAEAAAIVHDPRHGRHRHGEDRRKAPIAARHWAVFRPQPTEAEGVLPLSVYTDHELAELRKQGFTHFEIPDVYDANRQAAAYYAPNPALGSAEQLSAFVDRCHRHGLAVVIDCIPLNTDLAATNLCCFDGVPLYERDDPESYRFDTDNPGVGNFLLSHVRFWRERYYIDGFRLAADSFALYRHLMPPGVDALAAQWLVHATEPIPAPPRIAMQRLFKQRHLPDPFLLLGAHPQPDRNATVVRAILPSAAQAYVYFPDQPEIRFEMQSLCEEGLWQTLIPGPWPEQSYRLSFIDSEGRGHEQRDPYARPTSFITEADEKLFAAGNHYRVYQVLGAHPKISAGVEGVNFAVWAPNAAAVSVVGDFNDWNGAGHPMRLHVKSGIWELFVPAIGVGAHYKFEIYPEDGPRFLKSDPYAFLMQTAPATDSVVYSIDDCYSWRDREWLEQRRQTNAWRSPISIYEVHLGSWLRGSGRRRLNYTEMAERLIPYVKEMGFTHIEILPIAEHPYEPSWGYQVSNFYAPTSRLGTPEQLMAFVDQCHQNGIGVLLDWVAGHFPKDAHALAKFDGTHLYEHADPRQGEHKDWGTLIFNYGRHEAENFLIANALFWLEYYHFDGLRVDAVASMLYLDYSRKPGEWIPNIYGGNENLEAIEFLKHANYVVHGRFPGALMIAEESTAWAGVSRPTDLGGLGFGFKWNMGWMHDALGYLQTPPEYRRYHHNRLAFIFHYAFDENFILSLSHDEVVHLKGSLYTKMPGSEWEKFANLRLLFFFMFTHPGKKLNFMGAEFAQIREWSEAGELQWPLLEREPHRRLRFFLKSLNELYRGEPVLYEMDCRPAGFEWIDANNHEQSILVFSRKARDPRIALIVVINFSAISRFDFRIGVPYPVAYTEVMNSNDVRFGGLSAQPAGSAYATDDVPWHGQEFSIKIDRLPALSGLLLRPAPA